MFFRYFPHYPVAYGKSRHWALGYGVTGLWGNMARWNQKCSKNQPKNYQKTTQNHTKVAKKTIKIGLGGSSFKQKGHVGCESQDEHKSLVHFWAPSCGPTWGRVGSKTDTRKKSKSFFFLIRFWFVLGRFWMPCWGHVEDQNEWPSGHYSLTAIFAIGF